MRGGTGGLEPVRRQFARGCSGPVRGRHRLYERLRTAPPLYRFALAGVETDEFRSFAELRGDDLRGFPGLVVSDEVWRRGGEPGEFGAFSPGYRWSPYPGETWP
ncbi:hypothetical protein [Amycolatopsis sp. FDAARGOS 1241]|uniref:hypothetical protein n=1 Tax=Amycolatopsis sp. FDAARGOS 1241 TaxID=2778070 RepID=UPI001EF276F0|nr:hypothetical protein [Amycolatopsis sp. FDAARGOS 1241]